MQIAETQTVTLNAASGIVTTGAATAPYNMYLKLVINNSTVTPTKVCHASVWNGTNNAPDPDAPGEATGGEPVVAQVKPESGKLTVFIKNVSSYLSFNGTLKVAFSCV